MTRCDACKFWDAEYWLPQNQSKNRVEQIGKCRRHAPRPTTGDFEYSVLMALVVIAGDRADSHLVETWEEACEQRATWASTARDDWCGEFQEAEPQ